MRGYEGGRWLLAVPTGPEGRCWRIAELTEYLGRTWFPAIAVPQATADPKAVMIALVPARNVQMVSAASTVGVRPSADIAAPARRPPGVRAGGRVGEAGASRV